jgi:phenylacetate-CoA ligase
MINFINKNIFLPLSDTLQGLTISENLSFLLKSQYWSKEELVKFQEVQLQNLIQHIYENVPFYNEWFRSHKLRPGDIKQIEDLNLLPVLSKTEMRRTPSDFIAKNINRKKMIRLNSSGSTGEPFEYFLTQNAFSMKYAAGLRGWSWMGYSLGDHYAKLSQNPRSSWIKKLQDLINRSSYIYMPDLSENSLYNIIKILVRSKPDYIRCYPDPLFFIAKLLHKNNKVLEGIKAINSTGNILTQEARRMIEDSFGCPVFDSYSCEGSALFYEGPGRDNYLGSMEYAISEVLNDKLTEVNSGETGMHITTDLHNFAMPMIRYNTQDLVEKSLSGSACGRQLFGLSKIIGRDNDILITPSGNRLIVHLFTIYFEYFDSIRQFQIEQTQKDVFIIRLVVDDTFSSVIKKQIFSYWQNFLGKDVNLSIEIHDTIPFLRSGKRRFLIRNPEIKVVL